MQVILLERIAKLGQMGEEVRVRDGFARNFLLPQGKALRATAENKARFERERVQLEARSLETKKEADKVGEKLNGQAIVLVRQAGETGQLYGSVDRPRRRRGPDRRRLLGQPSADRSQHPAEDDRPARDPGRAPSGSRGFGHGQHRAQRGGSRAPDQGRGSHGPRGRRGFETFDPEARGPGDDEA